MNLSVAVTADRYFAVCKPFLYRNKKRSEFQKAAIFTCCLLGVAIGLPVMFGWSNKSDTCSAIDVMTYECMVLCCVWWTVSLVTIFILYRLIFKSISKHVSYKNSKKFKIIKELFSRSSKFAT